MSDDPDGPKVGIEAVHVVLAQQAVARDAERDRMLRGSNVEREMETIALLRQIAGSIEDVARIVSERLPEPPEDE